MSKLFLSYRRKSWPFTHRLADELEKRLDAEIFVDFTGVDEDDFEHSILRNLRESDAVLLVITEHTFADRIHKDSDWVRREIREALEHDIPIVLVAVEGLFPPSGLPDDIKDVARKQGIRFYPDYFTPAVDNLARFIKKIGAARLRQKPQQPSETEKEPTSPTPPSTEQDLTPKNKSKTIGRDTLNEALNLLDEEDFDKAIFLLEALKEQGFESRVIKIDDILKKARQPQKKVENRRQARLDYEEITMLAGSRFTLKQAQIAWIQWCAEYPDLIEVLDIDNLRDEFLTLPPPFGWIDIPGGQVTLESGEVYTIDEFSISKYPITNAQFQVFVDAQDGYNNSKWWDYSVNAKAWRKKNVLPTDTGFVGDDIPRTSVTWYEAVAFCLWLSEKTDEDIMLPSEQQWQRAAIGDTNWIYPWGNDWDGNRCNNSIDFKSAGISSVTSYEGEGDSPFGVVDMVGNVDEWCLTDYKTRRNSIRHKSQHRVVRGGNWTDPIEYLHAHSCHWKEPNNLYYRRGFRIARL